MVARRTQADSLEEERVCVLVKCTVCEMTPARVYITPTDWCECVSGLTRQTGDDNSTTVIYNASGSGTPPDTLPNWFARAYLNLSLYLSLLPSHHSSGTSSSLLRTTKPALPRNYAFTVFSMFITRTKHKH